MRKIHQLTAALAIVAGATSASATPAMASRRVKPTTTTTAPSPTTTIPMATTTTLPVSTTTVASTPTRFSTLAPGAALPSEDTCARQVRPAASEPRPENALANATVPPPGSFALTPLDEWHGYDDRSQQLEARVTGNFTGKTDEILQWSACKWGFDEDIVRAIAVNESWWKMSQLGDYTDDPTRCASGYTVPCPRSFGIHQFKWTSDPVGTFPWSRDSTAFNLDASLLVHRICFEGYMWWLRHIGYTSYAAGDEWGCVGQWYSGNWHDAPAETYITNVRRHLTNRTWLQPNFATPTTSSPTTTTPTTTAPVTSTTVPATTTSTTAQTTTTTAPSACCLRYDFEDGTTQGWHSGWGALSVARTTSPTNTGTGALAVTLSATAADYPAVQLSAAPMGLTAGMRVTYWVHVPVGSTVTRVQPYVVDVNWRRAFAPTVTLVSGWNRVAWTVPSSNGMNGIGLEIKNDYAWRGQLTLDSISW